MEGRDQSTQSSFRSMDRSLRTLLLTASSERSPSRTARRVSQGVPQPILMSLPAATSLYWAPKVYQSVVTRP